LKLVVDSARVEIGSYCFIGAGTELDVINNITIGHHTVIAPGCFITDHDHGICANRRIDQQPCVAAPVWIGSDVWIGTGVCILRGVTIGDGAVIGAGAVVKQGVEAYEIAVGIPAKTVGQRASRFEG
jgi:acetyltransferase-like isoleucine patch superfamily enzyme